MLQLLLSVTGNCVRYFPELLGFVYLTGHVFVARTVGIINKN